METKVQKWGNSLAVRIPNSYAKDINLKQGSLINILKDNDKIIIKPKREKPRLSDLLSQITEENLHEEIDTGKNVGKEIW